MTYSHALAEKADPAGDKSLTCPLCGRSEGISVHARARDIEYHTSDAPYTFHRCASCDILFINPMRANSLGEIYPANYYSFVSGHRSLAVHVKEWLDQRRFAKLLKDHPGDKLSVLDVGGGTGWLLDIIKSADPRVKRTVVVDIDADAEKVAEEAGHDYFKGRIEDYEATQKFDLILLLNLIEHVADPRAILLKTVSMLNEGGRLVIKTPNFDALDARLFRHRSWGGYHTPRHFILFQRDSLIGLCRECGFHVATFTYTQGAPFWSVSLLEELRRLGLVTISADRPAIYHPLMPLLQIGAAGFDFLRQPFAKLSQMELVLEAASGRNRA